MAATMQFDLVSPERRLASAEVDQVQIPGMEGDFTALPSHSSFLTTLRPGVVTASSSSGTTEYVVSGGFAEISPAGASVLAEEAIPRAELSAEFVDRLLKDAEDALESATEDAKMSASQRVRDVGELRKIL